MQLPYCFLAGGTSEFFYLDTKCVFKKDFFISRRIENSHRLHGEDVATLG